MAGFARETPRVLQAIIQSNPVLIPNPPQYDSVNPKPVLDAHVKAIQLTVRKLKRQATTATLKLGLEGSCDRSTVEAQHKILQRVEQCKRVILQNCQEAGLDIWGIQA